MSLPAGFVDIHTHIIPALDDGPTDLETALALIRAAVEGGSGVLVATSHSAEVLETGTGTAGLREQLAGVQEAVAAQGLDVALLLGTEVFLEPDTPGRVQRQEVASLNGSRYLLVELPFHVLPIYLDHTLFALQTAGYCPVIAHPERNFRVQREPQLLYDWVTRGCLVQVSAASLAGGFGRAAASVAHQAIAHNLCHAIASDAHDPLTRSPRLAAAFATIRETWGLATAQALLDDQPRAMVEDRPLSPAEPQPFAAAAEPGVWRRFLGRNSAHR